MEHPGILHLYCHLMELSHEPVKAMPAANALRTLFPLAGHLTHMASHIDIWAGHYEVRRRRFGSARNVLPTVLFSRLFCICESAICWYPALVGPRLDWRGNESGPSVASR